MRIVLFEDDKVSQLFPITLTRPAYTINCGSVTLRDWATELGTCVTGHVRPYLQRWQSAECPTFCDRLEEGQRTLWVNARVLPSPSNLQTLTGLARSDRCVHVHDGDSVAAAVLPAESPLPAGSSDAERFLRRELDHHKLPSCDSSLSLLDYPHQIVQGHLDSIQDHLANRIAAGQLPEIRDGVFSASPLSEHVVTDTSMGPVVIEQDVTVRPFTCLNGPVFLDAHARINEHSMLKNGVYIGRHAKVGGEIGASVIEAYSNKSHFGYLGHSYVGQWVNLGAGTSNSNLKNSYGKIRMEVSGRTVDTGMQFMGCLIGDMTKSAINTSIFTGKLIGACSMLYGYVTTNVPSFVNYARSFGQITEMNPEVVALTQKRACLRRGFEQQEWQVQLLRDAYRFVSEGRELADQPLAL